MDKWAVQRGRSLALSLVVMVILTTSLVIASYAFHTYQHRTEMLEEEILGQAQESAERLSRAIASDLQAGHLADYSLLVQTEMSTANHKALLAILLEASQLESAFEPPFSTVGLIKMPTGEVREFIPSQDDHLLASSQFFQQRDIRSAEGALLGHVKVYGSGEKLQQEKRNLLLNALLTALGLLLMQTVISATLIQWILTRPLQRITNTLVERDADGLPTAQLHSSSYTELSVLTDTVNEMLKVICKTRDTLRSQRERLENVIEGTDAGTWYWNIQTGKTEFNPRWAEIIGYQLHELEPISIQTWLDHLHPEDVKKSEEKLQAHFDGEQEYYQCEVRMRHRDGHWVWVMDRGKVALWDESGKPLEMFGTHIDISEDKAREQQLALAADVYKYVHEGILIANSRGLIVDVNRAFSQITGYRREEVIGQSPKMLKSGIHDRAFYHNIWKALHLEGCWRGEIWNKRKNGEIYPELLTISRVSDAVEEVRYVALFSDISALKEHEYHLEKIAHYDALTKLPNRLLLQERLSTAMHHAQKYARAVALLFIDLDGFKDVNDQYGHTAGDEVLCAMAHRMKTITREGDTLARLGGDEFIVVLSDIDSKNRTTQIVTRLLTSIAKPLAISGHEIRLSASIGISLYPDSGDISADKLIQQADKAMYQAKLAGKNGYAFFDPAFEHSQRAEDDLLERLHLALNNQELQLYYQPVVNLQDDSFSGFEALLRWCHPQHGVLLPDQFLSPVTNHAFITEIGEWVFKQALEQLMAWQEQGLKAQISVNVAASQVLSTNFVSRLNHLLKKYPALNANQLALEIQEMSTLDNPTQLKEVLCRCREIGVECAIDNFGGGYATLAYLKELPVQRLKLERSMLHNLSMKDEGRLVLQALTHLATAFNKQIVAVGLEKETEKASLLKMGCHFAQGFAIAPPMPAEKARLWVKNRKSV